MKKARTELSQQIKCGCGEVKTYTCVRACIVVGCDQRIDDRHTRTKMIESSMGGLGKFGR